MVAICRLSERLEIPAVDASPAEVQANAVVDALYQEPDGTIVGARISSFGEALHVRARGGVVLTTGGFVLEDAHRGSNDRLGQTERIAFMDLPVRLLLTGQPRAPRRDSAGAVQVRPFEQPIRI